MKNFAWNYGPVLIGVISTIAIMYDYKLGFEYLPKSVDYGNLYAAVFDWSAIQTGFLFAAFGYLAGSATKFIKFIEDTSLMPTVLGYVKRATYLGFGLTFISLPLLVFSPKITDCVDWQVYVIAVWFGLFVWSIFAFLRVAYVFGVITQRASESNSG